MKWYIYLIGFFVSVVLAVVGGIIFRFLEVDYERQVADEVRAELDYLLASKPCLEMKEVAWLEKVLNEAQTGGIRIRRPSMSSEHHPALENITNWDIQSTIFLALQVIGSVGYGNAPPLTTGGRVFCVLYGLFGLPLFVVWAYGTGEQLLQAVNRLQVRLRERLRRRKDSSPPEPHTGITLGILSVIGLVVFILVPAAIFITLEDWTYGEALYCCFVTVLTIGFADFIPGENSPAHYRTWYRLVVGLWIMLALLWFGGIFGAIRKLVKYDEIHKPFIVDYGDDRKNKRLTKRWKKHFDRQWQKLRGRRRAHQHFHNPARPSQEAMDARQRMAQLDGRPVFTENLPTNYDAMGNPVSSAAPLQSYAGPSIHNHISRVQVG